ASRRATQRRRELDGQDPTGTSREQEAPVLSHRGGELGVAARRPLHRAAGRVRPDEAARAHPDPGREAERVAREGGAADGDRGTAHPPGGRIDHARVTRPPDTPGPVRAAEASMKELVLFLAKQLVNHPDAVEVKETLGDTASVLELKVAKE